jgi:Protein of unknown function (DUF2917)
MACFEYGTIVDLAPRDVVTLPDMRSATLRVTRGTLWITQENDTQDVVLRPGDSWVVERNGLTIVEAQNDASFCVVGRRFETLNDGRVHRIRAASSWSSIRDALAAFFASSTRNPTPYY